MDQLKGAQGANVKPSTCIMPSEPELWTVQVLEIVLQYLRMNAEAYRHQGDVTNLPIEGLFLEQFDLPARVTSPDATELSPEDRNCLEAVYDDLSDTSAVNVASVKSVRSKLSTRLRADDGCFRCMADMLTPFWSKYWLELI